MIRTDSQDYGADEIICTYKITLLYKTTRFTSEIITLFRVSPQLFPSYSRMSPPFFLTPTVQRAACALHFEGSVPSKCNRNHPINQTSTPSFYLSHFFKGPLNFHAHARNSSIRPFARSGRSLRPLRSQTWSYRFRRR